MFDPTSRYYDIATATLTVTDSDVTSRVIAYKRRRFVPPPGNLRTGVEHTFTQGERLDLISAAYLDDSAQFWRICDANDVMHPAELEQIGRTITIAVPNQ
jgi:hypothetical protein